MVIPLNSLVASRPDLGSDCQQLSEATQHWLEKARPLLLGCGRTLPVVEVRCDLRGMTAGQVRRYHDGSLCIRYNLAMSRLQPLQFVEQTVPHEVAHVVAYLLHGKSIRPHGREWRAIMAEFGFASAERCHDFQLPEQQQTRHQRRWRYACGCREHALSTTRHNRVAKGVRYHCRECGEALERLDDSPVAD